MKEKKNMLFIGIGLVIFIVLLKPYIDDYFEEESLKIAIETCGGVNKVKQSNDDGFECN